ncbi:type II toxin-antitoxin system PrlF family antitoxin [Chroococcidiopsis sp. FACHB-1243]|uniref:AbrB/MazE/SpoVT family DNA-binding domain-containing protein n=1 Tax=Chroococcidiopsis sp. [FACHB-1243] TaxID=2692781 RepID=UPI001787612B|nr:type II toxin-antitoxin system PrlF family antitoxin [Chroococcidiopsis sp. [FACHB-1243]]MBD2308698.1 type II toxin-antitoxin system PrlF family antitoxin [Chroococcidiopsis sp. [FACHB-1243]]
MTSATVTSKGQVTIPKEIRDYLKLDVGSKVDFVIDADGQVKVIPLNIPAKALSGILHREGMKAATIEEMERAIAEGASGWT